MSWQFLSGSTFLVIVFTLQFNVVQRVLYRVVQCRAMQGVHNKLCSMHIVQSVHCLLSSRESRGHSWREIGARHCMTQHSATLQNTAERNTAHSGKTLEHTQKLLYTLHNTAESAEHCTTLYSIVKGLRAG